MVDTIVQTHLQDPLVQPLLDGLEQEYDRRYAHVRKPSQDKRAELLRYPPAAYAPPLGDFLALVRGGQVIAGGAYMSHDDETVEIKRVWTHADWRRQGLSRTIMHALEQSARAAGYRRAYLSTGYLQPEAVGLYLALGYQPLFDTAVDPALFRSLPFEKWLVPLATGSQPAPLLQRTPAANLEEATAVVAALKDAQELRILARLRAHGIALDAAPAVAVASR